MKPHHFDKVLRSIRGGVLQQRVCLIAKQPQLVSQLRFQLNGRRSFRWDSVRSVLGARIAGCLKGG